MMKTKWLLIWLFVQWFHRFQSWQVRIRPAYQTETNLRESLSESMFLPSFDRKSVINLKSTQLNFTLEQSLFNHWQPAGGKPPRKQHILFAFFIHTNTWVYSWEQVTLFKTCVDILWRSQIPFEFKEKVQILWSYVARLKTYIYIFFKSSF